MKSKCPSSLKSPGRERFYNQYQVLSGIFFISSPSTDDNEMILYIVTVTVTVLMLTFIKEIFKAGTIIHKLYHSHITIHVCRTSNLISTVEPPNTTHICIDVFVDLQQQEMSVEGQLSNTSKNVYLI